MDFDSFRGEWEGRHVADPTLAAVGLPESQWYQCVSLIKQYLREVYGIEAGFWGNAIDYWTNTNPTLLSKFHRVETTDVAKGDIVILKTINHSDFGGEGHIGIATGNENSSQFEMLEQNGSTGNGSGLNGDAIRVRYITKSRIAGVLRPLPIAPVPAPEVHPYTIESITPKQVRINKDTHRWGMTYDNFTAIANNPIQEVPYGTIITVVGICHHAIGYNYYLDNINEPSGFNVLDCDDYVPYTPPSGAIPVPTDTTPYELVVDVPGYTNSNAAVNHLSDQSPITLLAGTDYMIFKQRYDDTGKLIALNITKKQGVAGAWINPNDNVIPPEPPKPASGWVDPRGQDVPVVVAPPAPVVNPNAWKGTFKAERKEGIPNLYRFTRDIVVFDKETEGTPRPKKQMFADEPVDIWGWFMKDGTMYGRPWANGNLYWYGIPHQFLMPDKDFVELWNYKDVEARKNLSLQYRLDSLIEEAKKKFPKFFDIIKLK